MIADNTNHLAIACGYYAEARYSAPRGIFVTQFDITQQTPTMSHFIPLAMQVTSSKTDLRDMKIRHISLRKDGGIEFCAENVPNYPYHFFYKPAHVKFYGTDG